MNHWQFWDVLQRVIHRRRQWRCGGRPITATGASSKVLQLLLRTLTATILRSCLFQESYLHLQVGFKVLIQHAVLDGGERPVSSVVVILQQLLRVFDPHTVVTAAHAAVGGRRRRRAALRGPGGGGVVGSWLRAPRGARWCQRSRRTWSSWEASPPRWQRAEMGQTSHV